jgi:hypothetical protein
MRRTMFLVASMIAIGSTSTSVNGATKFEASVIQAFEEYCVRSGLVEVRDYDFRRLASIPAQLGLDADDIENGGSFKLRMENLSHIVSQSTAKLDHLMRIVSTSLIEQRQNTNTIMVRLDELQGQINALRQEVLAGNLVQLDFSHGSSSGTTPITDLVAPLVHMKEQVSGLGVFQSTSPAQQCTARQTGTHRRPHHGSNPGPLPDGNPQHFLDSDSGSGPDSLSDE